MSKIVIGVSMIVGGVLLMPFSGPLGLELVMAGSSMTLSGVGDALRDIPGTSLSVKTSAGARQVIVGNFRASGTIIYESTPGNDDLHRVVAWASHQCEAIDVLYVDGREVHLQASGETKGGYFYDSAGNKYTFCKDGSGSDPRLWAYNALGSKAGHWFSELFARDTHWNQNCTLNEICATHFAFRYNTDIYSGKPTTKAAVRGKNDIYDPRLGDRLLSNGTSNPATHKYTDNAALWIAEAITNQDWGVGATWDDIDIDQLIAAANICDELVPLALTGSTFTAWAATHAYTLNTTIVDRNNNVQRVQAYTFGGILQYFFENGSIPYSGSAQPNWNTSVGGTTTDNQIVWQNMGPKPSTSSGLSEKRYTVNGVFDYSEAPGDIIDGLLMACEGRISYSGGLWKIYPAAWYGTTIEFDEGDVAGDVEWTPNRKARDLCNAVRSVYVCPVYPYAVVGYDRNHKDDNVWSGEYQPTDAPEYACDQDHGYDSDIYLAQDGQKLYQDRRYRFVTSCSQTQRLMKIFMLRNRHQGSGTLPMMPSALQTKAQDVVRVTFPALQWDRKYLEVWNWQFVPKLDSGKDEAPSFHCQMVVNETSPSIYTWSTAEERGVENTDSPTLHDDRQVGAPSNLALESGSNSAVTGTDGVVQPRIRVSWDQPNDPFVTEGGKIVVQLQKVGDAEWQTVRIVDGEDVLCYIPGVVCGQQYNVRIYSQRSSGATSGIVSVGPHTVSMTTSSFTSTVLNSQGSIVPSQPIIINFSTTSSSITFTWAAQSVLRADGSTLALPAGSKTYSGLAASTSYYTYWYIRTDNGTINPTHGDPPPSSPSAVLATQTALDGRIAVGLIKVTTAASGGTGGGTGGGGDVCPDSDEMVDVLERGEVAAETVRAGEHIKGKCFCTGKDVYRVVIQASTQSCAAWRVVDGHRVSPCESIYHEDSWKPAYMANGAQVDTKRGRKVLITVEADEYGEHNYWLVAGTPLLIHNNLQIPVC